MRLYMRLLITLTLVSSLPLFHGNLKASPAPQPFQPDLESQTLHLHKNFILLKGANTGWLAGFNKFELLTSGKASSSLSVWARLDHTATIPNSVSWYETHLNLGTTLSLSTLFSSDSLDFDSLFNPVTQVLGFYGHFGLGDADGTGFTSRSFSAGYTYLHENFFQASANLNGFLAATVWDSVENHPSSLHISFAFLRWNKLHLFTSTDLTLAEHGPTTFTLKSRWIPNQNLNITCGTTLGEKITLLSGSVSAVSGKFFAGLELDYPLGFMLSTIIFTGVQF